MAEIIDNGGWVKIHRKMLDWEWFTDVKTFQLFMLLILKANHSPKKWRGKDIERGQLITSLASLSAETSSTVRAIRIALEKLEKSGEIIKQATNKFTIITVLKYEDYQANDNGKGQTKRQTNGKQNGKRTATNKNNKNIKNDKEYRFINKSFVSINFDESVQEFQGNKKYFFIAYVFWELWYSDNPNSRTMKDARVGKWVDDVRKIVELDKTSIERMIGIFCYFTKSAKQELGFDDFWFKTIKSMAAFRKKNNAGVYYIDQIIDKVNDKREKDKDFLRYVDAAITKFNQNEKLK